MNILKLLLANKINRCSEDGHCPSQDLQRLQAGVLPSSCFPPFPVSGSLRPKDTKSPFQGPVCRHWPAGNSCCYLGTWECSQHPAPTPCSPKAWFKNNPLANSWVWARCPEHGMCFIFLAAASLFMQNVHLMENGSCEGMFLCYFKVFVLRVMDQQFPCSSNGAVSGVNSIGKEIQNW